MMSDATQVKLNPYDSAQVRLTEDIAFLELKLYYQLRNSYYVMINIVYQMFMIDMRPKRP